jgi:hypothetical protein
MKNCLSAELVPSCPPQFLWLRFSATALFEAENYEVGFLREIGDIGYFDGDFVTGKSVVGVVFEEYDFVSFLKTPVAVIVNYESLLFVPNSLKVVWWSF